MDGEEPRLLNAAEVADRLGVCRTKVYGIIRELNDEMEARGCKVIAGRVCASTRGVTRTTWSDRKSCPTSRTTV